MNGESEWSPDPDGVVARDAARVLIFDPEGRVYLILGHDIDDLEHRWWFTVGGGLNGDEPREGAVRELWEETGLEVDPSRLVGPVLERTAMFYFARKTRRQREKFYAVYLTHEEADAIRAGNELTELEREVLDDFAWWRFEEIRRALDEGQTFYPVGLVELVGSVWPSWDGRTSVQNEDERDAPAPSERE